MKTSNRRLAGVLGVVLVAVTTALAVTQESGPEFERQSRVADIGAVPTDILHSPARVVVMSGSDAPIVLEELSGVMKTADDCVHADHGRPAAALRPPPSESRPTHRRRDRRHETRSPCSTTRGWLGAAPTVVVCLDAADLTEAELRQEVLKLRGRVQKLTALLRLALALLRTSGFRLTGARLPDGCAKIRILRAVDRAREYLPLRAVLRFLRVSPSRFHA
jgi:hypothetical protein